MEVLEMALMILGSIILFVGGIQYLFASFSVSIWWGLAVMLLPLAEIIFLFAHWQDAKGPFKVIMFGFLFLVASLFVQGLRTAI